MIIVFINCKLFPFVQWIISGLKLYETRNRNTLKSLIGKTVYLAETGKCKRPIVKCSCVIQDPVIVESKIEYNRLRKQTMVKPGSIYDFGSETKRKYLYRLDNVRPCKQFPMLDNAIYHGRIYATVND